MTNPIKPTLKTEILPLAIMLFSIITSIYFYFNFPARIPIHWNFAGQPDGYGSGQNQAIFFPLLIIGMYFLFLFLPYLDPKRARYEQFGKTYHIFRAAILLVLAFIYFITGLSALGYNIRIDFWIPFLIGVLFMVLGNYMGKLKPNWFMGIRTPWTLSSEEVWNKTHRFGGKMFMVGGALIMIEGLLPASWRLPIFIAALTIILFGTVVYSYIVYLAEKKKNKITK
jgi:uncharacterized membrane protein